MRSCTGRRFGTWRRARSAIDGPKPTIARTASTTREIARKTLNRPLPAERTRPARRRAGPPRSREPWWPRAEFPRWSAPPPTCRDRAGGETRRSVAPHPRTLPGHPPQAARRRVRASFARVSSPSDYASGVHRPRARADPGEAVAHRLRGDLAGPARGLGDLRVTGEEGREGRRVGASRPVGRAGGVTRAVDAQRADAVEEDVGAVIRVPTGDDHRLRPERLDRTRQLLGARPLPQPGQLSRLGEIGRGHRRERQY